MLRSGVESPGPVAAFDAVADADNVSYLLSRELRIVRVNRAWTRFADANGGLDPRWGRGAYLLDAIAPPLRGFYRDLHLETFDAAERREHDYECSSDEVFRRFHMIVLPVDATFLLVTHALTVERPHDREAHPADDTSYFVDGVLTMCAHCRRVRAADVERWDWVPSYVGHTPANVSHGLCRVCVVAYYPP